MFGKNDKPDSDLQYFSVYDTKVGHYRPPITAINKYALLRESEVLFTDQKHADNDITRNPEDFQLFKIGDFWKKTGELVGHRPEHVANFHEIKTAIRLKNQEQGIAST